jgi:hypothetical protein
MLALHGVGRFGWDEAQVDGLLAHAGEVFLPGRFGGFRFLFLEFEAFAGQGGFGFTGFFAEAGFAEIFRRLCGI